LLIAGWLGLQAYRLPGSDSTDSPDGPKKLIMPDQYSLIYNHDQTSRITWIQILIKGGKAAEPENLKGLAYLTTRLALDIPDESKMLSLMANAAVFSVSVAGDYSLITIGSLSEKLNDTLSALTKVISNPLFSGLRIDRIKELMESIQKMEQDDPLQLMNLAHYRIFFGDRGYGGSAFGSQESLAAIKKKDIINFYEKYFNTSNMVIAVSTDLDENQAKEIIDRHFSRFPVGKPVNLTTQKFTSSALKHENIEKERIQTHISLTALLPELTPENFVLGSFLETLLGKGIDSKLWFLRSKNNLAYTVNAEVTQMKDGGFLSIYMKTSNQKKEEALSLLNKIIQDVQSKGLDADEFRVTQTCAKAEFLRQNETKERRTLNLAYFEALGLGYDFYDKFFSLIDRISLEQMNEFIKKYLASENIFEVSIGPNRKLAQD
jgi:predicted Zn-dependent peptidase